MTRPTYLYATAPTGTVHVTYLPSYSNLPTLCGQRPNIAWVAGAETQTGDDATCGRCRSAMVAIVERGAS